MTCDHNWFPIRTVLWFKILCLRCDERRRVAPRWSRGLLSNFDVLQCAGRRGIT